MRKSSALTALTIAITVLASAHAALAAENRPGAWQASTAYCYTYQSASVRGRMMVQPPLMWTPYSITSWFGADGTMYTTTPQRVAYRANLQKVVNGSWKSVVAGPWHYATITGGGFQETPFLNSTWFEIYRRGTFRAVYQLYWYPTAFWPYPGSASGLAYHGPSGYAGYENASCAW
jgi:hypothetical protein